MGSVEEVLERLVRDGVHEKLASGDPTLWGPEAEPEARNRLGWLDLPRESRGLLARLAELAERCRGLDHVVLAGMGGSSLAPEVIARAAGRPLTVLDTTDPHQVRRVLDDRLDRTVVVISSKSGSTIETDSHRRIYEDAFRRCGTDPAERMVVVTDPGSPLEKLAADAGHPTVLADPNVGGRYSALTAFGLVPSALAGVPVAELLDDAGAVQPSLREAENNPGLELGARLGALDGPLFLAPRDGLPDWVEQLVAESTGKQGRGILPVVAEDPAQATARVQATLGAQFLIWEFATAIAGRVLGINPFDQPNVAESKENTADILSSGLPTEPPVFTDGPVEVYGDVPEGVRYLPGVLRSLVGAIPSRGYLAIMAYLDRVGEAEAVRLRPALAGLSEHAVTFGWGPRFLHSTGQYHKGGPQTGVFLQITGATTTDVEVPGKPYTLGRLQLAQALGDLGALRKRGRPAVRLHLSDRAAGLAHVLEAVR